MFCTICECYFDSRENDLLDCICDACAEVEQDENQQFPDSYFNSREMLEQELADIDRYLR